MYAIRSLDTRLQRTFCEVFVLEKNFTRFLRIFHLILNDLTEGFEICQASVAHKLEGDAFAGFDKNAFHSQALESKWNFKGVAGRHTVCYDVDFVDFTLCKGESGLQNADVRLWIGLVKCPGSSEQRGLRIPLYQK